MSTKRQIEIFSAGCPACDDTIKLVNDNACPSCEISVLDVTTSEVKKRVKDLNIKSIPAVVINGKLADCCNNRGPDLDTLKQAGLGFKG